MDDSDFESEFVAKKIKDDEVKKDYNKTRSAANRVKTRG